MMKCFETVALKSLQFQLWEEPGFAQWDTRSAGVEMSDNAMICLLLTDKCTLV